MTPQESDPFALLYHGFLRLLLFGGKGGVGKTTLAAAFSLYLSDRYPQKHFLVVSTDPAHSLSDSFEHPLGSAPGPVYGRANLSGLEINADQLLVRFREEHGSALKKILERGTYLDDEDLSRFLALSFPGLDEVMALIQIMDLVDRGDPAGRPYDLVIVDTAPTGHTLRLLSLPALMQGWTSFLDTLMAKHRYMARLYTRAYRPDEADAFITRLTGDIQKIHTLLQDEVRCRFVPIALAEPVVLSETQRLLRTLIEKEISVKEILINQVMLAPAACMRCRAMAETQSLHIGIFQEAWPDLRLIRFPASPKEIRGEERLRTLAGRAPALVERTDGCRTFAPERIVPVPVVRPVGADTADRQEVLPVRIPPPAPHLQWFLFCGKGGVGKTTLSSAFALQLSRRFPEKRVLLFSIDPAHSLSDCLGGAIGAETRRESKGIPQGEHMGRDGTRVGHREHLFAVEIDPGSLFSAFKRSYAAQIEEVFEGFSRRVGMDVCFDREVLTGLLDLAPPGLDEIMALTKLADYVEEDRYDLYVLDLAPTGHALRFLELPGLVQDWLRAFFEIVLKYRTVIRLPSISELLIELSKKVKKVQQRLSDPERCECIPVTIPTELALKETRRLLWDLSRANIPFHRLLINRVLLPVDGCAYCDVLSQEHQQMHHRFRGAFPELEIVRFPQVSEELKGIEALDRFLQFK